MSARSKAWQIWATLTGISIHTEPERQAFEAGFDAGLTAAQIAVTGSPTGHGSLNEGSRSQWYAHGVNDAIARIEAVS